MHAVGPRREVRKNALDHRGHFGCPLGARFGHLVHDGRVHSRSPGHRDRGGTDQCPSRSKGRVAAMECISQERRANMYEDVLKGKWKEIKGGVKEKWGKLTDDDLTQVEGNQEKLLGLLQQKYGYAKDKAEQEYNDFIGRYKGK